MGMIPTRRRYFMVKGISRQVIVVDGPEPKLFEQAIFILREDMGEGVTDEALLKEARQAIRGSGYRAGTRKTKLYGAFWASVGALTVGLAWLMTVWI